MRALSWLITLLLFVLLLGCSAGTSTDQKGETVRVGMHIDALLEFAIEYPLSWQKERYLHRAEDRGTVTWLAPPEERFHLRVVSEPLAQAGDREARLARLTADLPAFEVTHREPLDLSGRDALQVLGYTPRQSHELVLIESGRRAFSIQFAAEPETFGQHARQREEIRNSFVILEPSDVNSRPD